MNRYGLKEIMGRGVFEFILNENTYSFLLTTSNVAPRFAHQEKKIFVWFRQLASHPIICEAFPSNTTIRCIYLASVPNFPGASTLNDPSIVVCETFLCNVIENALSRMR
jgi:hypothetical protein